MNDSSIGFDMRYVPRLSAIEDRKTMILDARSWILAKPEDDKGQLIDVSLPVALLQTEKSRPEEILKRSILTQLNGEVTL